MVVDEAWAVLANLGAARFMQSSFKMARSFGMANVVVAHRVADLGATGETGSVVAQLSSGLLADCETVVCFAQNDQEAPATSIALGLSGVETSMLPRLRRGSAIWHVGRERYLVDHRLGPFEHSLVDTDRAMRAQL
jgi:hypothetical protein